MNRSVNLREGLLRQDQWTPKERTNYQQEIEKMICSPLTPLTKALTILGCILGIGAGVGIGALFIQENVPTITSIALGVMSIGGFNMAVFCASVLRAGGRSRVRHGLWHALHLATLSTMFLVMALVKLTTASHPDFAAELVAVAAIVQWVLLGILPIILWKSQMHALEQRQREILAQLATQQHTSIASPGDS